MSENQPHKVHLVSLGCPKNTVDSERMQGLLQGHAYQMTDVPEEADVVVVNTCGFIEPAKEESLAAIMDAHRLKQEGQCEGVIVTGCLSTRYYEELAQELVEADKLLTIADEADIVHHVDDVLGVQRPKYLASLPRTSLTPKHWAYLRISDGCDHQCAFCAIPAIRGRHVSEPVEQLVVEAERLAAEGVRELVLVSQDSVRYGADLYGRPQLVRLLNALAEVEGIEWMRLMYTYPAFWTEELIDFYAACDKMCLYIDMPAAAHLRLGAQAHEAGDDAPKDARFVGAAAGAATGGRVALDFHCRLPRGDRSRFCRLAGVRDRDAL